MTKATPARVVALEVLERVDDGAYSNLVLGGALSRSGLSVRDRAFVTDLVYGTLRQQGRLDAVLTAHLDRPIGAVDAPARAALRLGTYQLLNGVAPHAAVGETVQACAVRFPRARGFVNAVLRRVAEDPNAAPQPTGNDPAAIAARTSMPAWIADAAIQRFGDEAEGVLAAMNEAPTVSLRAHQGATTPESLLAELAALDLDVSPGVVVPGAVRVRGAGDLAALPAVRDGRATPQDEGSQAVVALVGAQPGERILEIAAAPGGKSTALAEAVGPTGLVVATDVDPGRVRRIAAATDRLSLPWCVPVVADGTALPLRGAFDRVLLDAPCSGLGVLRRRAEARWRITPADVAHLADLQQRLLAAAADFVRPGGRLVYSVCTWTPEETDAIAAWAPDTLPDFDRVVVPEPWAPSGGGGLITPLTCDGMYALVLERRGSGAATHAPVVDR